MKKHRRKSGRFARVKGKGIDRTELVKTPSGQWGRRRGDKIPPLGRGTGEWFVLPKGLKRLTLCVSKRRMAESLKLIYSDGFAQIGKDKRTGVISSMAKILNRMGGGVLYVAVEIDA